MPTPSSYLLFKKKNIIFYLAYPFLYFLSLIYMVVVAATRYAYKFSLIYSYRPKCKVISVGNITVGGTGKTPLVEWITNFLIKQKILTGIVIRGYHRPDSGKSLKVEIGTDFLKIGDEAAMLKQNLCGVPIGVGANKVKSVQDLESQGCQAVVLDDGFQHWPIRRDLDVLTIDTSLPLSGQKLIPLGRLRESWGGIKRATILILTKTDCSLESIDLIKAKLRKINPQALIARSVYQAIGLVDVCTNEELPLEQLKSKNVLLFSGIANPYYFSKMITGLEMNIKGECIYPDHYFYTGKDLVGIKDKKIICGADLVITTQKDALRLEHLKESIAGANIFYLKIQLKITENEKEFTFRLLSLFNR